MICQWPIRRFRARVTNCLPPSGVQVLTVDPHLIGPPDQPSHRLNLLYTILVRPHTKPYSCKNIHIFIHAKTIPNSAPEESLDVAYPSEIRPSPTGVGKSPSSAKVPVALSKTGCWEISQFRWQTGDWTVGLDVVVHLFFCVFGQGVYDRMIDY